MRTLWQLLLVALVSLMSVLLVASTAAAARYDPSSSEALEENGFTEGTEELARTWAWEEAEEITVYCKSYAERTDDDSESLPIDEDQVQAELNRIIEDYAELFDGGEHEPEDRDEYAWLCVSPDNEDNFFCVSRNRDIPANNGTDLRSGVDNTCWGSDWERIPTAADAAGDALADPLATVVGNPVEDFARDFQHGVRSFFARALYWWIATDHIDVEESGAGALWPSMLGYGILVGTLLMIAQGIRMMVTSDRSALLQAVKGLFWFGAVCAGGVGILGIVGGAADAATNGFLEYPLQSNQGCVDYQASQPDDLTLEFPTGNGEMASPEQIGDDPTDAELGRAVASCAAARLAVPMNAVSAPLVIFLYVIAFVMSLFQAILLFIREAGIPLLALLLPIAAAGQIGWGAAKRWLPGILAMVATILLYKPMAAFIFAVGFLQANLSDDVVVIMTGLVTLFLGVVAPGVMMKVFTPLMAKGMESSAGLGSVVNNAFMGSQIGGSVSQWVEKRGGESAARAASARAAQGAAHQGGGLTMTAVRTTAAAAEASNPVGWVAAGLQALKGMGKWVMRGGRSEAQAAEAEVGAQGGAAHRAHPQPTGQHAGGRPVVRPYTPGSGRPQGEPHEHPGPFAGDQPHGPHQDGAPPTPTPGVQPREMPQHTGDAPGSGQGYQPGAPTPPGRPGGGLEQDPYDAPGDQNGDQHGALRPLDYYTPHPGTDTNDEEDDR